MTMDFIVESCARDAPLLTVARAEPPVLITFSAGLGGEGRELTVRAS